MAGDPLTILITGASGGIGQACARVFSENPVRLVLHYHTNRRVPEELAGNLGVECMTVQADLTEETDVADMFDRAVSRFTRVDAIVVNAGIWPADDTPLHEMTTQRWRRTINADLTSAFFTCRTFLRHLADQPRPSAAITLVASTAAIFGEAGHADYSCAKAAMAYGLTRSLKNEIVRLAPEGRVNCVCPGWTRTPMAGPLADDPHHVARVTATASLRKIASPEDVARAVAFLTQPGTAGHITGAILPVAGGLEGRLLHDIEPG